MNLDRRQFVHGAGALAVTVSLAGCNGGGNGNGGNGNGNGNGNGGGASESEARVDTFLSENEANLYDGSVEDLTGEDEITVAVGAGESGLAYDPPAARIDVGTTAVWEWTGRGGRHNVNSTPEDESDYEYTSGDLIGEEGHTWSYTFESGGVALYYCEAHRAVGHLGALIVE